MSTKPYQRHIEEDARLVILKELAAQSDGRASSAILGHALDAFGHTRSPAWLLTQLAAMRELGAIETEEVGSVVIAKITKLGVNHCLRREQIVGIKQPSLGA